MQTPIYDFLERYAAMSPLRLHMPGHKGHSVLGIESLDLTEVLGADSLYEAEGIIKESEDNASTLFRCPTYFSTEGSSLCIRAMLYLAMQYAPRDNRPLILAGRNAHKTFLTALGLLDIDVAWLRSQDDSYLSCTVTPEQVSASIEACEHKPLAVYLTSPDYLGNMADIQGIAEICHEHGILLLVDNAHGAYLKFLSPSLHPIDLGADICCDSAHKTLPVLTGGAYLHISPRLQVLDSATVKGAMALFGSTSPSYLIMASLDMANKYLSDGYGAHLQRFLPQVEDLKKALLSQGFDMFGNEPLKITLTPKPYGYTGYDVAQHLAQANIICEFADPDFCVLMVTPDLTKENLMRVRDVLGQLPRRASITTAPPKPCQAFKAMPPREALLSPTEEIPVTQAIGRILGIPTVGCPPAVPIVVSGESIDASAVDCFVYYGITTCRVIKKSS